MHLAGLRMKARLAEKPLYFLPEPNFGPYCIDCIHKQYGAKPPKGSRKVPLYQAWNYGFHTCKQCGYSVESPAYR